MHRGSLDKAEELLRKAIEATPSAAAPYNALGKLCERKGDFSAAENTYRKILKDIDPKNSITSQALALVLARHGNRRGTAVDMFKKSTQLSPTDPAVWQAWALYEWKRGKYSKAKELFEKGLENAKPVLDAGKKFPPLAALLAAYAKMEAQRRNRTKARSLYRQAISMNPLNAHTWVGYAQLEGRLKNYATAIDLCHQALKDNPNNVYILCTLGQVYYASGNIEKAVETWEKTLEIDPGCAVACHELGIIARQQGEFSRAEDLFRLGMAQVQEPKGAQRCASALADVKMFQGDGGGAREAFVRTEQLLQPAGGAGGGHRLDGRLLREWAGIEKRLGDLTAASALYERAAEADPRDERTWLQWGLLEKRRGQLDSALRCWHQGIKISPLNPFLWQLSAVTLWECGREGDARTTFHQALRYCPTNKPLLLSWALKEAGSGNTQAALDICRLGGKDDDVHAPLLELHAQLASRLGLEEERVAVEERVARNLGKRGLGLGERNRRMVVDVGEV